MGTTKQLCSCREYCFIDLDGKYHIVEAVDFMAATTSMDTYLGPRQYIYFPYKPEASDEKKEATYYPIDGDLPGNDRCGMGSCRCGDLVDDIFK